MWRHWVKSSVNSQEPSVSSSSVSSPFSFSTFKDIQNLCTEDQNYPLPTRKASYIFRRVRVTNSIIRSWSVSRVDPQSHFENNALPPPPCISIPGAEKRIVVYFTSLRIVRSTFEDCRFVLSIVRGFRVSIDERDLAMDAGFISELQQIFGGSQTKLTLPRVFIGGRYIGGADEIRELNEVGELKKIVEGLPAAEPGVCHVCCGYRFILCQHCNGSHKLYIEKSGFKSCTACNENGLIRCPSCSSPPFCCSN